MLWEIESFRQKERMRKKNDCYDPSFCVCLYLAWIIQTLSKAFKKYVFFMCQSVTAACCCCCPYYYYFTSGLSSKIYDWWDNAKLVMSPPSLIPILKHSVIHTHTHTNSQNKQTHTHTHSSKIRRGKGRTLYVLFLFIPPKIR